jgi:hypothetical protein
MNVLLKAMLKELADLVAAGKDAAAKNWGGLLGAVIGAGEDAPAIVSNWADLKPELAALLANPAADADLLAYGMSLLSGESAAVQAVIQASAKLLLDAGEDVVALVAAIKAVQAPAVAPAPAAVDRAIAVDAAVAAPAAESSAK